MIGKEKTKLTELNRFKDRLLVLLSIFFVSISLFVYQVVLTRIYSTILWYHYVFLITSFAVCGLGIGSIIAYKQKKSKENRMLLQSMCNVAVMLTIFYTVVLAAIYFLPFMNSVMIYTILGTLPFVMGGYFVSILFREFSGICNKLYFADLIGSGAGSIIVLSLLNYAGIFRTALVICLIATLAAVSLSLFIKSRRVVSFILLFIFAAGLFVPGGFINNVEKNFNPLKTNTKKTFGSFKKEGKSPEIVYTKWNAFSRTDVVKIPEIPNYMVITIDGAANAPMMKFDGNIESLEGYKEDTEFLPFAIGSNNKTLIIGPGGGRDILYALAGGSKDITAVEINTSSIDAVREFSDYNGSIYDLPQVKVYGEDGRNFARKTKEQFDTIFLSLVMTNASQGMGYALSENYIYTVEAMQDYLDKLSDNGKIAFIAHDQEDLGKLVSTAILALKNRGISEKEASGYIALLTRYVPQAEHEGNSDHIHNPVVIIKNKPFTEDESQQLMYRALQSGNIPLYAPHVYEEGPLSHLKEGNISIEQYLDAFSTNVTPATDDSPYFFNFDKGIPSTLIAILFMVGLGSVILFAPFAFKERNLKPTLYFSLLGAGFMMIEIPLIQKFILYLGHPVTAFTYVLAALLIGCGLGGFMSNSNLFNRVVKNVYVPPVMVALVNIVLILVLGAVFEATSGWNLTNRILISSLLVMIEGFFMGMPFPRGLKLLGEEGSGDIIPVMWGINGVMAVLGSVLSIIFSMTFGFNGALIAGSIMYMLVSLLNRI